MASSVPQPKNRFLLRNKEDADLNQYWYSAYTIQTLVEVVKEHLEDESIPSKRIAFLSTPSIYFSLDKDQLKYCTLLDYDNKFEASIEKLNIGDVGFPKFLFYDFNQPTENIDEVLKGTYSLIIVDPPFITNEVWEKYSETIRYMGSDRVHILCSTIAENEAIMERLLQIKPVTFKPNIPNLVYQYNFYANFDSKSLSVKNQEIGE